MCGGANGISILSLLEPGIPYYVAFAREGNDGYRPIPDYNRSLKSYQQMVKNLEKSGSQVLCSAFVLREEIPLIKKELDAQENLPGVNPLSFLSAA